MKLIVTLLVCVIGAGCVMSPMDYDTYNRVDPSPRYISVPPPYPVPPPVIYWGPAWGPRHRHHRYLLY